MRSSKQNMHVLSQLCFPSRKQLRRIDAWRNGREAHRGWANSWEALESDLVRYTVGVAYRSRKFIIFCGVVQSLLCNQRAIVRPRGVTITLNWSKRSCEHPRLISGWVIRPRIRRCRLRRGNSCESSFFVHAIVASQDFGCNSWKRMNNNNISGEACI